jgi:hypothetical protein
MDSEHGKRVVAHAPNVVKLKTKGTNFLRRTQVKNQLIMRHIFDRLVETCGPYDGLGAAKNYKKSGMPLKLKWGGPETDFDVHLLAWQLELVEDGLIERDEMLSMASLVLALRWAVTAQPATELWRAGRIIFWRRPAAQAGWLLLRDQLALEEKNLPVGYTFKEVTKESAEDFEPDV